jgi:hypothetical protein
MNGEVCWNVDTTNVTDERANRVIAVQKVMMSAQGYYFCTDTKGNMSEYFYITRESYLLLKYTKCYNLPSILTAEMSSGAFSTEIQADKLFTVREVIMFQSEIGT